jgi:phosphatidylglycerol---prolipoprotein diacylglyceryl transferase
MEFQREIIEIGSLQIRYYGIIIVLGMLVATAIAAGIAKRTGRDPEHVYGALTWAIIPGIIGARLWFVLFPPEASVDAGRDAAYFFENFFDLNDGAIAIWSGGLSIFGAVIGGLLGAYIYLRKNDLPVLEWLDIGAIVLPLGQAIGRFANFVNQELFGTPITQEWLQWAGLDLPRNVREAAGYSGIRFEDAVFHPLFAYEALWSFLAFVVLFWLYSNQRDRFRTGDFFLIYIIQYSFIRFWLEFIRVETTMIPGTDVNLSQAVCVVGMVIGLVGLFIRHQGSEEGYTITPMRRRENETNTAQPAT